MKIQSETQTGLAAEFRLIPAWAWILAGLAMIAGEIFFNIVVAHQSDGLPVWARPIIGTFAAAVPACYFLFLGYISRDASRRAMSPLLWILIVIFIPNGLGLILYFILRKPLSGSVSPEGRAALNFCPRCNYKLNPSCPQCHRSVGVNDLYCSACGTALRHETVPASA